MVAGQMDAKTVEKVRQVEEQLNCMRDAVGEQGVVVGDLVMRLSDVLRNDDVKEDTEGATPEMPLCDLAGRIRNVRRDIENHTKHVKGVLQRLEL